VTWLADRASVVALLQSLPEHVATADATFQLRQQLAWNALAASQPLLEGYDRLANLGLESVELTLALIAVQPSWWRRVLGAIFPRLLPASERFRLVHADDERATLRFTLRIRRDASGRFTASMATEP